MWNVLSSILGKSEFMPHGHCYFWRADLVWTHAISDSIIGIAYFSISLTLYVLIKKIRLPFTAVVLCFGVFIGACGLTHLMDVWTLWIPSYWVSASIKVITAIASLGTGIYLYLLRGHIVQVAEASKYAQERHLRLEQQAAELERMVQARTKDLQKAIRARDEFISIASHELKTPITSMQMQSQMLNRAISTGKQFDVKDVLRLAQTFQKQLVRLTNLVEDMLDISRINIGQLKIHLERINLAQTIREAIERFKSHCVSSGCVISLQIEVSLQVNWDPARIEQVLVNLLSNAVKYGEGKPIEVNVRLDRHENVEITVTDHGRGIPVEDQQRIFDKFERAISASSISGFGLGLYIVKQIITAHRGTIQVVSTPGKGSTFIVVLPIDPEKKASASAHTPG